MMADERELIQRGFDLRALSEGEFGLYALLDKLKSDYIAAWELSNLDDTQEREAAWHRVRALMHVHDEIERQIEEGAAAEKMLEGQEVSDGQE